MPGMSHAKRSQLHTYTIHMTRRVSIGRLLKVHGVFHIINQIRLGILGSTTMSPDVEYRCHSKALGPSHARSIGILSRGQTVEEVLGRHMGALSYFQKSVAIDTMLLEPSAAAAGLFSITIRHGDSRVEPNDCEDLCSAEHKPIYFCPFVSWPPHAPFDVCIPGNLRRG